MAEDIGSLVVRVAMENSSFEQGMQSLNRSLKIIESDFKTATARLGEHGKGIEGLKTKVDMLSKSIDVQSKIVKEYEDKIKQSNLTLENNAKNQIKLADSVVKAEKAYKDSQKTLGKNAEETQKLKAEYEKLQAEFKKGEEKIRNNQRAIDNWTIKANNAKTKLGELQGELSKTNKEIDTQSNKWANLSKELEKASEKFKSTGDKIEGLGKGLTTKLSLPLIGLGTMAAKASIDFESAFAGVKKTVNGTEEQFKQLEKGISDMSKKLPTNASDIAHVAEAAGQLGVQTDNILGFTKTIIDLGNATNLVGEEGASQLAKFANITQMSQKDFEKLGSTIVDLGNNMATTEADIVAMGMRLAGAGKQVGLTEAQIMGLSAALSSVGIEAEAGGSSISKVMIEMQLAVEKGGQSLNSFAKVAGMSSNQFKKAFKNDAAGALIEFIKGLSESEKKGTSAIKVLDDMGITEIRMRDALLRAAGAGDLFNKSIDIGTNAWKENTALVNEANQRYATTESQLKITKNQIVDSARKIGNNLLPVIRDVSVSISNLTERFSNLSPKTQENIIKMGAFAIAIGPVLVGIGALEKGIGGTLKLLGTLTKGLGAASAAATATTGAAGSAATAAGGLGLAAKAGALLLNPWTIGIGAAALAGYGLYKVLTKEATPAVDLFKNGVKETTTIVDEFGNVTEEVQTQVVKISDATKEAVGAYLELDKEASKSLFDLRTNSTVITEEVKSSMISKFSEMNKTIVSEMQKKNDALYEGSKEFFTKNSALTDLEEQNILKSIQSINANKLQEQQNHQHRIQEILNTAANDKRKLTAEEQSEINAIQEKMRENAVKTLSASEEESTVILQRLKDYAGRMTADQAVEMAKNAKDAREKSVQEAEKQYNETIKWVAQMKERGAFESEEQANRIIEQAKRQRDESITKADEMQQGIIQKIKDGTPGIEREVNLQTGSIKKSYEKLGDRIGEFFNWVFGKNKTVKENIDSMGGSGGSGGMKTTIGMNASGTNNWRGGLTWIDEEGNELIELPGSGPKLVDLPRGTKIYNNSESEKKKKDLMNQQQKASNSIGIVPRKLDFFNLDGFNSVSDPQKKSLESIRDKYDKLYSLNDLESTGLNIKTNSQSEELAKMSLAIANQIEKLEILKREYAETKNLLGGNSKEVVELEKKMSSLNIEIENNKKALEEATINNKYKTYYDNLELSMINLGISTKNANEELNKQENILQLQREKLEITKAKYQELRAILGDDSEEVIRLRKEIASLSVEITNNSNALNQSKIRTIFKSAYEDIELALINLSRNTKSFSEEIKRQEEIYSKNFFKLITMKEEYKMLSVVLGESSEEVKGLKKEIASLTIELENSSEKLKSDTINYINTFNNSLIEALKNRYNQELKLQEESINNELKNLDKWKDESLSRINDVYDSKIKAIEESSNIQIKAIENEIKAIDAAEKEKDRADQDAEELKRINGLKSAIEFEHNEFNKAELQKELNKAIQDREKRLHKEAVEDKKEALRDQIDAIKENSQKQKQQLELDKKYELERITSIYEFNKQSLNNQLDNVRKFYENKTNLANLQAESEKLIMDNNQKEIIALLKSYSPSYEEAGKTLGERMAEGFKGQLQAVISMIEGIESRINALRDTDIQNALNSARYTPISNIANTSTNNLTTNSNTVVNNNNNVVFNSPKALSPSEVRRQTETTLRNLSFA